MYYIIGASHDVYDRSTKLTVLAVMESATSQMAQEPPTTPGNIPLSAGLLSSLKLMDGRKVGLAVIILSDRFNYRPEAYSGRDG